MGRRPETFLDNPETCGTFHDFHVVPGGQNKFEHVWLWSVKLCPAWACFLDAALPACFDVLRVIGK